MKKLFVLMLCCCFVILSFGCQTAETETETNTGPFTGDDVLQTVREAYTYAFPLVMMELTMKNTTNVTERKGAPVNQFYSHRAIAAAHNRAVVRPNIDTLYSVAWLDLSDEPIIFSKPETDIYCSAAVFDAYTNCAAVLGTGGLDNGQAAVYAFCGPGYSGETPVGAVKIDLPTNMVWIIVRAEYDDNFSEIFDIQDELSLLPLSERDNPDYIPPPGTFDEEYEYVALRKIQEMDIETFFNAFNRLSVANPGTAADKPALERFAEIGVGPGLEFSLDRFSDDIMGALSDCPADVISKLANSGADSGYYRELNGWLYFKGNVARFGTDYDFRAAIAIIALGANPNEMSVYPEASCDSDWKPLDGKNNYVIHFEPGKLPPCDGFWSITAYDGDWFLIDNPHDKYAIRGKDDLAMNPDGSLDIYLQRESPGEALAANWLPVSDSSFQLTLRIYLPDESVLNFDWEPPAIRIF